MQLPLHHHSHLLHLSKLVHQQIPHLMLLSNLMESQLSCYNLLLSHPMEHIHKNHHHLLHFHQNSKLLDPYIHHLIPQSKKQQHQFQLQLKLDFQTKKEACSLSLFLDKVNYSDNHHKLQLIHYLNHLRLPLQMLNLNHH